MRSKLTSYLLLPLALAAAAIPVARAEDLPTLTGEKANLTGGITPPGDEDTFQLELFPGDKANVKVKDAGPLRTLVATLRLYGPTGSELPVTVKRQDSARPSFKFEATTGGIHVVSLTGGGGGDEGNYTITVKVKRTKSGKTTLDAPGGGNFAIPIKVTDGAQLDVKMKTKKGGFDVTGLFRPDGLPEAGFVDALTGKAGRKVKAKKFPVTGGFGTYELRGSYLPGSKVKVSTKVRHAKGTRTGRLSDEEPDFDPFLDPFPASGIGGTLVTVVGRNLRVGSGSASSTVKGTFEGGDFTLRLGLVEASLLNVTMESTGGGFDVAGLFGPGGNAESGFLDALTIGEDRMSATTSAVAPFEVTRGTGWYELRGTADAGAEVDVEIGLVRGDGADVDGLPRVFMGSVEIDPRVIDNPFDQVLRFRVPDLLTPNATYDIRVRNRDGQGAVARDAFYFVPPPTVTNLTQTTAGPAGGRSLRILGDDFRAGVVVLFDETVVQPEFVLSNRIDVIVPPHAPGDVFPVVRDDLGQTATSPFAVTYLDVGSNEIDMIEPSTVQAIGGETVVVTGVDFGVDSELFLDDRPIEFERVSDTELRFVAPDMPDDTYELRVEDSLGQSSTIDVAFVGFVDDSQSAIPTPISTEGQVDSWRGGRVLVGDVTGDGIADLVVLRSALAFGSDAERPRIRILSGDGEGGFSDATDGIPDVTAVEDWNARDGALFDANGDEHLDIVVITDEELDGGDRSGTRLLLNDGEGNFTDATGDSLPMGTTAGDRNQGVAIVAVDVDGQNGTDLVIVHTTSFEETIDESPPLPQPPPDPPPPPVLVTYVYPGTRVLLNDGDGIFTRDYDAMPPLDEDSFERYDGSAIAAGDVDGQDGIDFVVTSDDVLEDPDSEGTYLRRAVLLLNDGSGLFSDASDTWFPAGSGSEYLQGDHVVLVDHDGSGDGPDLVVASDTRLVTPGTGSQPDVPALRIFQNDGSSFAPVAAGVIPARDRQDALQCNGVAFGDLNGDGRLDAVLVSPQAPNSGEHGARVLVQTGDGFRRGSDGFPDPLLADDGRGRDVALLDGDDDGDLDVVVVRDEAAQTVRNTRVFANPRVE